LDLVVGPSGGWRAKAVVIGMECHA
jgi:hypothetical protein